MMPLFWTAVALITGILLGKYVSVPVWGWAVLGFLSLLLIGFFHRVNWYRRLVEKINPFLAVSPLLLLFFLSLGGFRYSLSIPIWNQEDLAWYNDRGTVNLVAVVDRSPDVREDAVYLHLSAREVYDPGTMTLIHVHGSALALLPADTSWQLGDLLRMDVAPKTPSENADFSYRAYLEHQGIYSVIYHPTAIQLLGTGQASKFQQIIEPIRRFATRTIYKIYPQPESGLLEGILLGNDNNLPETTARAYQNTGTAHIIAISGFNMAILAAIFTAIFTKMTNRYWSLPLTALVLTFYSLLVGGSPSVVRAAIMAVVAFGGRLIGRKNTGLNALGLTAGIMCLIQPQLPWDVSFQLSFMATLGLVLFADPLKRWLESFLTARFSEKISAQFTGPISEYFLFTLAAQITTLPVIMLQFKQFSLTSIIANPLVLPVQPAVLVGGMLATLMGMLWLPLGKLVAILTWPLLAYSNRIVTLLDQIHGGTMTLSSETTIRLVILFFLLLLIFIFRKQLSKIIKNIPWFYLTAALGLVVVIFGSILWHSPDGILHVRFIRTGNETSLFLQSPSGTTFLIDPSSESNSLSARVSALVSPWYFHVDNVLVTNLKSAKSIDDLNDRLPVNQAILAPPAYLISQEDLPVTLPDSIKVKKLGATELIQADKDLSIIPIAVDLHHTAILIRYGQVNILIPGGTDTTLLAKQTNEANSILVLNEADIENLPADMWSAFRYETILWNSASIAPDSAWQGLDEYSSIEIRSNGSGFSINPSNW